ncbi:protein INSYN2B [Pelodytes ibericus]
MGRNETNYLQNITCDSMEQQTMKVRPALLKRKNLDSAEHLNNPHQRRIKSQQVRFKEDSTNPKPPEFTGLEIKPGENILQVNGKTEQCHSRSVCLLSCPKSQKVLQNIAIQTSPRLRKHFPIFKDRKLTKHVSEFPTESSYIQFNGDLSNEDMATQLAHLRIHDHVDGPKGGRKHCLLKQTVSKAQCNGPIFECSGMDCDENVDRTTVSTQVPDNTTESSSEDFEESNFHLETDPTIHVSSESPDRCSSHLTQSSDSPLCSSKCTEPVMQEHAHPLKQKSVAPLQQHVDGKNIITLTPSLNSSLSYCFHSEHKAERSQTLSERILPPNGRKTSPTFAKDDNVQAVPISETGLGNKITQTESSQCTGGAESHPCFPKIDTHHETKEESKRGNPGHKTHGEVCSLQGKLQSVEESLQSNQEKIKILLNVIQDLEKARALSEGRNFYRTGQDLNNCSTCQSTACIIYSVEYDFRQQEGRFHPVLKMLDKAEQCPPIPPHIQKPETDNVIPEKQDVRKKAKKVKKKCFWWI